MQKVLSIDGGGIRGIIPAMVLAEIERRTGKTTSELFDLVAGTSTGGILALGLTKPGQGGKPEYSAKRLIELYETEGRKIFSIPVWHRIHSAAGVAEEKYPEDCPHSASGYGASINACPCPAQLLLFGECDDQFPAEVRNVGDDPAPDQVPVPEGRLVYPYRPSVLQVVLDA